MYKSVHHQPDLSTYKADIPLVQKHSDSLFSSGTNYLIRNEQKLWELHVEGDPLQRGLITGSLAEGLLQKQERIFFSKIEEMVPSQKRLKTIRKFLKWYNRKLYLNVKEEYKAEIYGLSRYSTDDYDYIASKYLRSLYLHGAHDIGHALQDLMLVGCSSMAVWGEKSEDGSLLIGRNFDFYAGDEFAQEKLVAFVRPTEGYPFMSFSWAGMMGVVSGMNLEGLTVTINAGKSKIPLTAKTPISILTREILQYAATIDEAIAIARKHDVFVSESIMVGSARDGKAVLIEVSPSNFGVYEVENSTQLICSNHFQSQAYASDKRNITHIEESHSKYRYERMQELLAESERITPQKMADILRNKDGLNDLKIGYGNEKSLNQLLAHHAIIFKPEQRIVWVSSNPYQLGEFVAYDLNAIFGKENKGFQVSGIDSLTIPKDEFLNTRMYADYEKYRVQDRIIDYALKSGEVLETEFIKAYQALNPEHWVVYYKAGKYFYGKGNFSAAETEFQKALTKEVTTVPDKEAIMDYLKQIDKKK